MAHSIHLPDHGPLLDDVILQEPRKDILKELYCRTYIANQLDSNLTDLRMVTSCHC